MNVIKINLQTILTDNKKFDTLCKENPWGFIIESGKTRFKVLPQQQWDQICYKNHWSISILEN